MNSEVQIEKPVLPVKSITTHHLNVYDIEHFIKSINDGHHYNLTYFMSSYLYNIHTIDLEVKPILTHYFLDNFVEQKVSVRVESLQDLKDTLNGFCLQGYISSNTYTISYARL